MFGFGKKERASDDPLAGASGFGKRYAQVWEYRPLPGAGAQQYAWETLVLPLYSAIGWGQAVTLPMRATDPTMSQKKGITLTTIGNPGILHGQFVSQPLMSEADAAALGITTQQTNPFNVV